MTEDDLPAITFEVARDEGLYRGIYIPHFDGVPILPGVVVEPRCRIEAELEGLVYPGHDVWCRCGLAAARAIGFGTYHESNGLNGPVLRAVVERFQWVPPIGVFSSLWVDRHVQPDEICQLGMRFTNWRARVVAALPGAPVPANQVEWLHQRLAAAPKVSVLADPGHPSGAFYRYWEQALFGDGINEDYKEVDGHYAPEYPYRRKFIVGDTLIAPLTQTVTTPYQGLQAYSVLIGKEDREAVERHTVPLATRQYRGVAEFGDWVAFPLERYGEMELGDCRLVLVCPRDEDCYLFNRRSGMTLGPVFGHWALRLPSGGSTGDARDAADPTGDPAT